MREFKDMASFITHFATLEVAIRREANHALEKSAVLIEKTAKEELGHYLDAIGPFPEWDPLEPATIATHNRYGVGDSPLILTGELYASIEHETEGGEAVVGTKMTIGEYQEFGTDKIPPRPFMGPAVFSNKKKIEEIMAKGMVHGLIGGNALLGNES